MVRFTGRTGGGPCIVTWSVTLSQVILMSSVKITNGRILTASDTFTADVYVENGVISHIARELPLPADRTIDAAGHIVMPGGIDVHTHLDMPFGGTMSADDFRTGTTAAAHGGTTSVIDFAIQTRGKGLYHAFDEWRGKAEGKAVIDYAFHMIVLDLNDQVYDEMHRLATHDGLTSFKLFMAYPGVLMVDDGTIFKVMLQARESGGLICMHAENGHAIDTLVQRARARGQMAPKYHALTRPPQAEAEATHRALALAEMAGAPIYIVHVTCNDSMSKIAAQRERGLPAYGETCTQYLFLSYEDYERPGFEGAKFVMSPPLRDKSNQPLLWKGLRRNDLQVVSTDHCPFSMENPPQKQLGKDDFSKIPNGAPGIEDRLMMLWDGGVRTGQISEQRFVEIVSTNPAKMFGLWPRKGTIAVGADADIVVWDPNRQHTISAKTHHMNVDYNMYEGRTVTGAPSVVLSRGDVIVENGAFAGAAGRGQYVKRQPGLPAVS